MTTKMYPTGAAADATRGDNTAKADTTNAGWGTSALLTAVSGGGTLGGIATSTVAGPTNGIEITDGTNPLDFISQPLAADVTISGTVTFNVWGAESATAANTGAQVIVERLDSQLAIASTIINSEKGTELPKTTRAAQNWTGAPTSTNMLRGDRIRVRLLGNDAGGTMASGNSFNFTYDGGTPAADGDTWVQFNENLTFETTDPTGSQLFLTTTGAGINPGSATEDEAWTSRGSGSTNAITNTTAGWTAPIQITATAGGTALEWYSKQLTGFTLGGKALFNVRTKASATGNFTNIRAEIAVCDSDGTNPAVWGASNDINAAITTVETARTCYVSGDDTTVADAKRLRFRLYLDDQAANAMSTGKTITISYAGTSAGAAGDTYVTLPQTVTEYVPPVAKPKPLPRYGVAVNRASTY